MRKCDDELESCGKWVLKKEKKEKKKEDGNKLW